MTLIAAFRCDDGVVICGDSKESYQDFYTQVDKLDRLELGSYEGVISGAGNEAGLIDGFTDVLIDEIRGWSSGLSETTIKGNIRQTLRDYYSGEVASHPAQRDDKYMEFIICVKPKESESVFLWKTDSTALVPINRFQLIGFDTEIFRHEVGRLYGTGGRPGLTRAVALGIHLLALAKATCLWVGGPTRVAIAKDTGIHLYEPEDVTILEDRAQRFSEALAELTTVLPDVSVSEGSFIEVLAAFEERVLSLRGYYLRRAATTLLERALNDPDYGEAVPSIPPGMMIARSTDGSIEVFPAEDTQAFLESVRRLKKVIKTNRVNFADRIVLGR